MTAEITAPRAAASVVTLGCVLLVLRPLLVDAVADPTTALVLLFVALAGVGMAWPIGDVAPVMRFPGLVLAAGIAIFAAGRLLGGGHPPQPFVLRFIVLNSLAAVAEEAFFRRLLYRLLEPSGAAVAVAGSALLFAIVHVTVYGLWVLPIDLAAGAVLSWQRWAAGSWRVPVATHVVANVLVVI